MTIEQFIAMIGEAETGGVGHEPARAQAIGDSGLAGGYYQQHWAWRRDYWPTPFWDMLRTMDAAAIRRFVRVHPEETARELADRYNLGHSAPDPGYDQRCLRALATLGIAPGELDDGISG